MSYVDLYRSPIALMENVAGLGCIDPSGKLKAQASAAILIFLNMGYQVNCGTLDSAAFGVPQSRTRLALLF